jgi:PAS domain S-box-containing protein
MQLGADRERTQWFGVRMIAAFLKIVVLCTALGLSDLCVLGRPSAKNVLVVFSAVESGHKSLDLIESGVRARFPGQVNFSIAYLDYQRVEDKSYAESLAEIFRRGYKQRPDVLIASSIQALQFLMEYRDKMFPGVPIVFLGVSSSELEGRKPLPGVTGVTASPGLRETIDLALHLEPDTNAVAVITDTPGDAERHWLNVTHAELLRHQDKIKEIDIVGPPSRLMIESVSALPPHTVALFQLAPESSSEPAIGAFDVLTAAAQHVPTYSAWQGLCLNYGCIGGVYVDWEKNDLLSGDMAARVLSGERPENIPIVERSAYQAQVDWRPLQRWHIPESALPAGSVVLYREPTMWERDRKYFLPAIVLIAALLLLVAGLLWERATKRKAESRLRESEERFRVMADTTPSLLWMCDAQGKITYLNDRRVAFTGPDPEAGYGDSWIEYMHPDDQKNVDDVVSHALKNRNAFSNEYRLRRRDGVYRWMFDVASPRLNGDGSFAGFIGSAIDVTDHKMAQQALEEVSGQLIEAQENERGRIARDLHDDICQRLALLSMEIAQADRSANVSDDVTKQRLREIQQHCAEIAGDVQSLSHQLHSSRLDYLGIAAAIRGFCEEFSKQHEVSIEFTERDVPADLLGEISVCLFRVAQEALHNAVKYSGGSKYAVELAATADEIQLAVSDSGRGFDVVVAKRNRGLGLVSMQERVHLVHGSLYVESKPGKGTRILAIVPVAGENRRSASLAEAVGSSEHQETNEHFAC